MKTTSSSGTTLANDRPRERIEHLLRQYPDIGEDESVEILCFLKTASALEIGLLSSNEAVEAPLRRFRKDHAGDFSLGWQGLLILAIAILAFGLGCFLLWDAGAGR